MNTTVPPQSQKGYRGLPMEGMVARWYARITARNLDDFRRSAADLAAQLAPDSSVLEVAPGPGYLAIELARRGTFRIVGLDISQSFVRLATENAARAGVAVTFMQGDAAALPFAEESFDFLVCRAAFKNFAAPVTALREMHRVLRHPGKALIIDLRPDASPHAIAAHVDSMKLGWFNALLTKWTFKHSLLKRAYSQAQFRDMVSQTLFQTCTIREDPIGMEITLVK